MVTIRDIMEIMIARLYLVCILNYKNQRVNLFSKCYNILFLEVEEMPKFVKKVEKGELEKNQEQPQEVQKEVRKGKKISKPKKQQRKSHQIQSGSEDEARQMFEQHSRMIPEQEIEGSSEQIPKSKSILKKDEEQKQNGKTKKVSFKEEPTIYDGNIDLSRKWNDPIINEKKGTFSQQEQKIISDAVGQFCVTTDITFDNFSKMMSGEEDKSKLKKQKLYVLFAGLLPNRSPMSCYKFLRRTFNENNKKGSWTSQQQERLVALQKIYGHKWKMIAKQIGRTGENVYDKWRSLNEQKLREGLTNVWKLSEFIELMELIQVFSRTEFLDHNVKKELDKQEVHNRKEQDQILAKHKYNTKSFVFHNMLLVKNYVNSKRVQSIKIDTIKWTKISQKLVTRTPLDCRNKFIQLLQCMFRGVDKDLDIYIVSFLEKQKLGDESQIDWKKWTFKEASVEEGRNRFMIMKKMIEGRSLKNFSDVLREMGVKVRGEKNRN